MIKLLAKIFRGVNLIFGVSAPPEGQNERTFVLIWLGVLAFLVAFGVALTYFLPYLYFKTMMSCGGDGPKLAQKRFVGRNLALSLH